jgi:hypothetical protein
MFRTRDTTVYYLKKALQVLAHARRTPGRRRRRRPLPLAATVDVPMGDGVLQVAARRLRRDRRIQTCCTEHNAGR